MVVGIIIRIKDHIPDASGEQMAATLQGKGFDNIRGARVSKYIEVTVRARTRRKTVEKMCQELLANRVTETYEILWSQRRKSAP